MDKEHLLVSIIMPVVFKDIKLFQTIYILTQIFNEIYWYSKLFSKSQQLQT
jgi:hypothetical protein